MTAWKLAYHANCWGGLGGDAVGVTSITQLAYRTFGDMDRACADIAAAGYAGVEMFDGNLLDHSAAEMRKLLADNVLAREQNAVLGVRSRGIRAIGYLWNSCPGGLRRQEVVSSIANTGSDWLPPSPSLRRDPKSQAEGPNIIYEVASCASTAL